MTILEQLGIYPPPHPFLPLPEDAEVREMLSREGGERELDALLAERERIIRQAEDPTEGDPFRYGFELPHWKDAHALIRDYDLVYYSGGIRASKTEDCAKQIARAAAVMPHGLIWCFSESPSASVRNQQMRIWKYLPKSWRKLNGKKSRTHYVHFDSTNGFQRGSSQNSCGVLTGPNGTQIIFLTYNQLPEDFQGFELGFPSEEWKPHVQEGPWNLGAWCDEGLTSKWLSTLIDRCLSRRSKILWSYAPKYGVTPAIKEIVGGAKTLESRPAELLADRVNVPGLPKGEMPYIQVSGNPSIKAAIIYFWNEFNTFSGGNYEGLKGRLEGKPSDEVKALAYGYATEVAGRQFKDFGAWNIIHDPADLPAEATTYHIVDPADGRPYFCITVRVANSDPQEFYIVREWPDHETYGEWAKLDDNADAASKPKQDGIAGPAQQPLGFGVARYKQEWLKAEEISGQAYLAGKEWDPYRITLLKRQTEAGKITAETHAVESPRMRFMDPRAFKAPKDDGIKTTTREAQFAQEQKGHDGALTGPRMVFKPAYTGGDESTGLDAINELLHFDRDQPLDRISNSPRLFVWHECRNVIWALSHYTGADGPRAACKDPIDCLRYMAMQRLRFVSEGGVLEVGGGGNW
jgi:hypothetical protein